MAAEASSWVIDINQEKVSQPNPKGKLRKRSFLKALESKYCNPAEFQPLKHVKIVFHGKPKADEKSELGYLRNVVLSNANIAVPGLAERSLQDICPHIVDLDISGNLFDGWKSILKIVSQLNHLKYLNLSRNPLKCAQESLQEWTDTLPDVDNLVLNGTEIPWTDVLLLTQLFKQLKELHMCANGYSQIPDHDHNIMESVEILRLNNNKIENWEQVWKLKHLPNLKSLILSGNPLQDVYFHDSDLDIQCLCEEATPNDKTAKFVPESNISNCDDIEDDIKTEKCVNNPDLRQDSMEKEPEHNYNLGLEKMEKKEDMFDDCMNILESLINTVTSDQVNDSCRGNSTFNASETSPQFRSDELVDQSDVIALQEVCDKLSDIPCDTKLEVQKDDNNEAKGCDNQDKDNCDHSIPELCTAVIVNNDLIREPNISGIEQADSKVKAVEPAKLKEDVTKQAEPNMQMQENPDKKGINGTANVLFENQLTKTTNAGAGDTSCIAGQSEKDEINTWTDEKKIWTDQSPGVTNMKSQTCPAHSSLKRKPFHVLETICLSETKIGKWKHLTALSSFPALESVRIKDVKLGGRLTPEDRRKLFVPCLPNIKRLNGSEVTVPERDKGERYLLRYFCDKPKRPAIYTTLEQKHGTLTPLVDIDISRGYQERVALTFIFHGEIVFSETMSVRQPVGKLKLIVAEKLSLYASLKNIKIYHKYCNPHHQPDLLHTGELEELVCDTLPLSRFDIMDGDEIHVDIHDRFTMGVMNFVYIRNYLPKNKEQLDILKSK